MLVPKTKSNIINQNDKNIRFEVNQQEKKKKKKPMLDLIIDLTSQEPQDNVTRSSKNMLIHIVKTNLDHNTYMQCNC